jgi:hypothetical protein
MDTNSSIKVLFGSSFKNQGSESLSNLSCMRTEVMESQHSASLSLMSDQFRIAIILTFIVHVPFQRFENTSISDDVLCTKDFSGFLFRISAAAILYWSKYCCWNVFVTHQSCLVVEKSRCQQTTGHNGCWGKLQSAMTDISDSVNVIN